MVQKLPSRFIYIDFSGDALQLGGSAFAQSLNKLGAVAPTVRDPELFAKAFNAIQTLARRGLIAAQHDVSAGGLVTTLLEMTFANVHGGMRLDISDFKDYDMTHVLFAENPAVVIQVRDRDYALVQDELERNNIPYKILGRPQSMRSIDIVKDEESLKLDIDSLRDVWYRSSFLLDCRQSGDKHALLRLNNYRRQPAQPFAEPSTSLLENPPQNTIISMSERSSRPERRSVV